MGKPDLDKLAELARKARVMGDPWFEPQDLIRNNWDRDCARMVADLSPEVVLWLVNVAKAAQAARIGMPGSLHLLWKALDAEIGQGET